MLSEQEKQQLMKPHLDAIAKILYQEAVADNPNQLKTLEGIELCVRDQVLKHVSPEIGIFLSKKRQEQQQEEQDISKAALVKSRSMKSKQKSSKSRHTAN
jgi:hypothetical protein